MLNLGFILFHIWLFNLSLVSFQNLFASYSVYNVFFTAYLHFGCSFWCWWHLLTAGTSTFSELCSYCCIWWTLSQLCVCGVHRDKRVWVDLLKAFLWVLTSFLVVLKLLSCILIISFTHWLDCDVTTKEFTVGLDISAWEQRDIFKYTDMLIHFIVAEGYS